MDQDQALVEGESMDAPIVLEELSLDALAAQEQESACQTKF